MEPVKTKTIYTHRGITREQVGSTGAGNDNRQDQEVKLHPGQLL